MNTVHPVVSDLYVSAHQEERLAEAEAFRRGKAAARAAGARRPLGTGLASLVGAALVRVGSRLQGASGGETIPAPPVPSPGTVR